MRIPESFRKAIAETFYDKKVNILTVVETVDAEGGVKRTPGLSGRSFMGNVNFNNPKEVQEELGLTYDVDVAITTNDENVRINDLIEYNDIIFTVTDVVPHDSHKLVVATKYGKV